MELPDLFGFSSEKGRFKDTDAINQVHKNVPGFCRHIVLLEIPFVIKECHLTLHDLPDGILELSCVRVSIVPSYYPKIHHTW